MGRSKNHGRRVGMDDTEDDDTMSSSSTATSSDFSTAQDAQEETADTSQVNDFVDYLYEKRAKTREEGLQGLVNALRNTVLTDFIESKYETLLHLCIGSLKKGTSSEIALASQVIGLISITSGAGDVAKQVLSEASSYLIKAAKSGSESKARIAALEALALASFIGGTNYEATEDVMVVLWQIAKHKGNHHSDQTLGMSTPSAEVRAAALSAWTFLLTDIPNSRITSTHMPASLSTLSSLLENEDQSVRISSGEASALLFEIRNESQSHCSTNKNEDELVEQVRALALEAGGKGQVNKKVQRSSFKEILAVIEGGPASGISVKLKQRDVLSLQSWTQMIQYNFFRHILADGLQRHLQENTLLHEIFGFTPLQEKKSPLTSKEKRMYMSPNSVLSKARTQEMNQKRSQAHAGHFGVHEGDYD